MSKVSALASAAAVADADLAYIVQGGVSKQASRALFRAIYSAFKAADEAVVASAALQNDNDLILTLPVGNFMLEGAFFLSGIASLTDAFKCALDGGTIIATNVIAQLAVARPSGGASDPASVLTSVMRPDSGTTSNHIVCLSGHIEVGTTGTLGLRWAQGTAAGTTTMKRGSWLQAIQN